MTAPETLRPGFVVMHGHRLETLAEAMLGWMATHPLAPLDEECVLVPSNGMAEWFKGRWAEQHGVAAALRVELPARFVWRAYRAVLGPGAVASSSPLDKAPLAWRLMRLLPEQAGREGFEPLAAYLAADLATDAASSAPDAGPAPLRRRWQLAQRLADLFDQYQVYRPDWLGDWARGHDGLRGTHGQPMALPEGQGWQPRLWRALLAELSGGLGHEAGLAGLAGPAGPGGPGELADAEAESRPALHRRFIETLARRAPAPLPGLPRRLLLFGTTHLPAATLEALGALARHLPVLLAVANPSRLDWTDTLPQAAEPPPAGARRPRHPPPGGAALAALSAEQRAALGHPLLSAWGRQSRDFLRQLERFDEGEAAAARLAVGRIDLFDEPVARPSLLQQLQQDMLELVPAGVRHEGPVKADDRSIEFALAHGALREVELLHDRLLEWLAAPPPRPPGEPPDDAPDHARALEPRDIVVMVPDIERFAPAVAAVFGRFAPGEPRHVPWSLVDRHDRGRLPLLRAVEWLLGAPAQRFGLGELRELLAVPAVQARLGLDADDAEQWLAWAQGAGVRWGLDLPHRAALGAAAAGETGSWAFGLDRLLMGYATGPLAEGAEPLAGIEPHAEVAGLDAPLAGRLAEWLARLDVWRQEAAVARPPAAWAERLRRWLDEHFEPEDDASRRLLGRLREALAQWADACEAARFDEPLPLALVAEAWLAAVDEGGAQRFRAGSVTFCTLMPLRAVPFHTVCLLGMNEGEYPREAARNDFDLMAVPGTARPGDRARRDDDRQLMLDALLAARERLYISWSGKSARDDSDLPPSLLVAQLREHLAQRFGPEVLAARTTAHPLQPFSRRYFEAGSPLSTLAQEWRALHEPVSVRSPTAVAAPATGAAGPTQAAGMAAGPAAAAEPPATLAALSAFVRQPVKTWFGHRLGVRFKELAEPDDDDEPFVASGLEAWQWVDELLEPLRRDAGEPAPAEASMAAVAAGVGRLARLGRLPLAGPGERLQQGLRARVESMRQALANFQAAAWVPLAPEVSELPSAAGPATEPLRADLGGEWLELGAVQLLRLRDGVDGGAGDAGDGGPGGWCCLRLTAGRVLKPRAAKGRKPPALLGHKLVDDWLLSLALAAAGRPARLVRIAEDALVEIEPAEPEAARETLRALVALWREAMAAAAPLPAALATGLAELAALAPPDEPEGAAADPAEVYDGNHRRRGEVAEPCLARLYPDYLTLEAQPGHAQAVQRLYGPLHQWLAQPPRITVLQAAAVPAEGDEDPEAADDDDD